MITDKSGGMMDDKKLPHLMNDEQRKRRRQQERVVSILIVGFCLIVYSLGYRFLKDVFWPNYQDRLKQEDRVSGASPSIQRGHGHQAQHKTGSQERTSVSSVFDAPIDIARQNYRDAVRLGPDRQFFHALKKASQYLGIKNPEVQSRFDRQNKNWVISLNQNEPFTLPAHPRFEDYHQALISFYGKNIGNFQAPNQPAKFPSTSPQGVPTLAFSLKGLIELGTKTRASPQERIQAAPDYFTLATQAAFILPDSTSLNDPMTGLAWSSWALADHFKVNLPAHLKALLVFKLGYLKSSEKYFEPLQGSHPDIYSLFIPSKKPEELNTNYFKLYSLIRDMRWDLYLKEVKKFKSSLPLEYQLIGFRAAPPGRSTELATLVLMDLPDQLEKIYQVENQPDDAQSTPSNSKIIAKVLFESLLDSKRAEKVAWQEVGRAYQTRISQTLGEVSKLFENHPLLSPQEVKNSIESIIAESYKQILYDASEMLGSHEAVKEVFDRVKWIGQSDVTDELSWWVRLRGENFLNRSTKNKFFQALKTTKYLDGAFLIGLYRDLTQAQDTRAGFSYNLTIPVLASRLDQRPRFARDYSHYSQYWDDLTLEASLLKLLHQNLGEYHTDSMLRWAKLKGDPNILKKLYFHPSLTPGQQAQVLDTLDRSELLPPKSVYKIYSNLAQKHLDHYGVVYSYAEFLARHKRHKKVVQYLHKANQHLDPSTDTLSYMTLQENLAIAHLWLGNLEQAHEIISPLMDTYKMGTLLVASQTLAWKGKLNQAQELLDRSERRYPDSRHTWITRAATYWIADQPKKAAQALSDGQKNHHWAFPAKEVAEIYARVFKHKSHGQSNAALEALTDPQTGLKFISVAPLAHEFEEAKHRDWAKTLVARLPKFTKINNYRTISQIYQLHLAYQGPDKALAWLDQNTPRNNRMPASVSLYQNRLIDPLWQQFDGIVEGQFGELVWYLRMAGYLLNASGHTEAQREVQKAALLEYYSTERPKDLQNLMGRYAMGIIGHETFAQKAKIAKHRIGVFHTLGLLAEARGDLCEAIDWYSIVLHTPMAHQYEVQTVRDYAKRFKKSSNRPSCS